VFKPAKQTRIYQDVVEQIQEAILAGQLKVGEQLPAERKLIDMFGVSRGTLREALRVLQQKGLIEIKTGVTGGSIIRGVTTEQFSENLAMLIRYQKVALRDLAEFREGIEGTVALLAAERATPADVAQLRDLLAQTKEAFAAGPEEWDRAIRCDEQIHLTLTQITGNPLFITVLETVYLNIHTYYERFLPMEEAVLAENITDLESIVEAVAAGDGPLAYNQARSHVQKFTQHMESRAE
jgi:GntR family transcriptional regulator, transcriptional repressor for pyruvate dehydrogenase complex